MSDKLQFFPWHATEDRTYNKSVTYVTEEMQAYVKVLEFFIHLQ